MTLLENRNCSKNGKKLRTKAMIHKARECSVPGQENNLNFEFLKKSFRKKNLEN